VPWHEPGEHPERPERLGAIETELERRGWLGYERREAPAAPLDAVTAVHSEAYVEAVRSRSASRRSLDGETVLSPGPTAPPCMPRAGRARWWTLSWPARLVPRFCGTRPPGHHARSDTTSGFCLFNNVAVAAQHALDALGARRVFIFDWDVHHGDGTNDVFRTSDAVLFASIHQSGIFPGTGPLHDAGSHAGEGFSINLPVPAGSAGDAWISLLEHVVVAAALEFRPDLVLISAGFDAHRDDVQGGCELEAGDYAEMARHLRALGEAVGAPVGAVLEGGYALAPLAASVAATLEALASDQPPDLVAPDFLTSRAASHIGHRWIL
jgi:acetoin utilization deacetylase AcuC-like enzyme